MPPRPFPYPLRIGNDICSIRRVRRLITRNKRDKAELPTLTSFIRRILTPPEIHDFWHRFGPEAVVQHKTDDISRYLAGRFAAKEACRKACPHFHANTRGFQRILILPGGSADAVQSGRPRALILDAVYGASRVPAVSDGEQGDLRVDGDEVFGSLEGQVCEVSISHDGEYAVAVALVPEMENGGMVEGRGYGDGL